jgi:hypothetical protein
MSGKAHRSTPRQPDPLRARVAQADHLARALRVVSAKAAPSDPAFLWLLGRADEVRTLVDEIVREWAVGSIETASACEAIRGYADAIHVALHRRYGGWGASCCGPHLAPFARPSVKRAYAHAARPRLESGVDVTATDPPRSRREQVSAITAPRRSVG